MAIRDLWAFENGPAGLVLSAATLNWFNNTGHSGIAKAGTSGGVTTLTSDGWARMTMNTSGSGGSAGISVQMNALGVAGLPVPAGGIWVGFRLRSSSGALNSNFTNIFSYSSAQAFAGTTGILLNAATVLAAGGCSAANVSNYFEVFIQPSASTFQVWMDGKQISSGSVNNAMAGTWFLNWGCTGGSFSSSPLDFQIRDVYFVDVSADGIDAGRLGPIQGNALPYESVDGSEYVLNAGSSGVTTLQQALTTPLQNPPLTTPNIVSPTDKQPLTVALGLPSVVSPNAIVIAVQPMATIAGSSSSGAQIQTQLQVGAASALAGTFSVPDSGQVCNLKLPIQRKAPDGTAWSTAKIADLVSVLTPQ